MNSLQAEIVIVGGGVGGCAAALAATESGRTVILIEETDWLGGQFTTQLVPPDEHGWIEQCGRTESYQRFRTLVRAYYAAHYPLTDEARREPYLNPGTAWVSPLAFEPKVAVAVLQQMLQPQIDAKRLRLLLEHTPVAVKKMGADRLAAVVVKENRTGVAVEVAGKFILDATELGDLLALAEVEHVTGQESQAETGEPSAPMVTRPMNLQAFTWCFAIEHVAGASFVGSAPADYDFWARYSFPITPPWPGRLLSLTGLNPRTMQPVDYRFEPNPAASPAHSKTHGKKVIDRTLWTYRRILDRRQFLPGAYASDVVVINWPMNDYLVKSLIGGTEEDRVAARRESRQLSLSLLYWLQTEAPRTDGGRGWPGLRLRPDIAGTSDGLAKAPYIREARRLRALVTVREQDVSPRGAESSATHARSFEDSVGVGSYRIDLHPSHGGDNFVDVPTLPFQIPLGALVPVQMENLLPAGKNLGTTHLTNGCYRLHPVEWNVGEAAGALAAFCLEHAITPQRCHADRRWCERFQRLLSVRGIQRQWPQGLKLEDGDPHRHAHLPPNRSAAKTSAPSTWQWRK